VSSRRRQRISADAITKPGGDDVDLREFIRYHGS
jgi:hypothetical protein